jgi:hypothetical protein
MIDLGKWASGAYKISSPILDPEVLENISDTSARRSDDFDREDEDLQRKRSS